MYVQYGSIEKSICGMKTTAFESLTKISMGQINGFHSLQLQQTYLVLHWKADTLAILKPVMQSNWDCLYSMKTINSTLVSISFDDSCR